MKHRNPMPHITDHAIVRYLQRVKGMDIEEIKKEKIPIGNKTRLIVVNEIVITVTKAA